MLTKVRELIDELSRQQVQVCHWKSNLGLAEATSGLTDLDLLVSREKAARFRTIVSDIGFQPAVTYNRPMSAVEHFYALDEGSGVLVHLHAYFRVITGESLAKNFRLPVERMLLENIRMQDGVPLPTKSAELVVFTLRMMVKHTSLVELVLLLRQWDQVREELQWLSEGHALNETTKLVERWLPPVDPLLFRACVGALESNSNLWKRIMLGRRLRKCLRVYRRYSTPVSTIIGLWRFTVLTLRRVTRSHKRKMLMSGGGVVAIVGPEACGKSTVVTNTSAWLGKHFTVEKIHAGKPPATALSAVPRLFLPLIRAALSSHRSHDTEHNNSDQPTEPSPKATSFSVPLGIRSVMVAYERQRLLRRAFASAANGTIVLCDRYPSTGPQAPDSPRLTAFRDQDLGSLRMWLVHMEERLYRHIPHPDLVLHLTVPVDVAVARNADRDKTEPVDYVRRRHADSANLDFGRIPSHTVSTEPPVAEVLLTVKKIVWNELVGRTTSPRVP